MCTKNEYRLRMKPDNDAESPREWDNLGTMVCWHDRYDLGDETYSSDPVDWRLSLAEEAEPGTEELIERQEERMFQRGYPHSGAEFDRVLEVLREYRTDRIDKVLDRHYIMLPLYLYDHGSITMSTGTFSCPWDSGKVGYIYVSKDRAKKEFAWKRMSPQRGDHVRQALKAEVAVYDMYLHNDVWGFIIEKCTEDEDGDLDWEEVDSCWGFYGDDPKTNGMSEHIASDLEYLLDDPIREF